MPSTTNQNKIKYIDTPNHFNFLECLVYLNRSDDEVLHLVRDNAVRKLVKAESVYCLFEVTNHSQNKLCLKYLNCNPAERVHQSVAKYVSEWFDFKTNLSKFHNMAETDKRFGGLVKKYHGLRIVKIHNLFQALCWAIIGQQINIQFAYKLCRRFVESYGESLNFENQTYWFFPEPEIVAGLRVENLRSLQFTGKKSEYIINLAKEIVAGNISKEMLSNSSNFKAARQHLLNLHGVGPWTANYVLMRCLGDPGAFPYEDIGLHNAIKHYLNLAQKPTINEIKNMMKGWAGWEAYIAFYLYRSLL